MSALKIYVDQAEWLKYYAFDEQGHLLSFIYSLLKWLDRDHADALELTRTEFTWYRDKVIVGRFPITIPEPTPTFKEFLLLVLSRDDYIKKFISLESANEKTTRFIIHSIV